MIITEIQNYLKQNTTHSVNKNKTLPISFGANVQLNRDVFVPHDDNNSTQQYLKIYEPGNRRARDYANSDTYEKAIQELNSDKPLDLNWVKENSKLLEKVFGLDFSKKSPAYDIFLSELNSNRDKICKSVINSFQKELLKYYELMLMPFARTPKARFENFNLTTLKKYNFLMSKLDYDKTVPEDFPLYFRTTKPLPDVKKLQKYTNANIIDAREAFNKKYFLTALEEIIETVEKDYKTTGKRSIILMSNLYRHAKFIEGREFFWRDTKKFQDNYAAIFVTEDIPPKIRQTGQKPKLKFTNTLVQQADRERFIKDIIEPIKNNKIPQAIIFDSKTSQTDTLRFLQAGLNEIPSKAYVLNARTNVNDFANIVNNIKNNSTPNNKITKFLFIPQAYKYISNKPENVQLINSLTDSDNKLIPILYTSYPDELISKMNNGNENNNTKTYTRFTLSKLSESELEYLLKYYSNQAEDAVDDLITLGKNIEPLKIDLDFKQLAQALKLTSYGIVDITNIISKSLYQYVTNGENMFNDNIQNLIIGGLNNEN